MQRLTHITPRSLLVLAALGLLTLSGCTPPQDLGEPMAEPVLAAPPETTERKAMPTPCDEDDDGIGGTGCPVE
ncbi:hypothetical protein RXV86_13725 [Alisedimentitalea sp. MJ-SS2]|uniref:hypothetical protein n=1 Tax=Aliisedimentitalea sp. MJ-SS2 TaxID=3049795 RepID=UPI0029140776|nr:hypothetical protein [Alisedimentitalea sp. MJ-SS2]MDU8928445.1 hypothetical protein [Alisedimentitalea sp. MJ-SS2]